ncbi:MAG: hypothetical protein AAFN30_13190 [Actinomycetota bacterium]
MSGRRDRIDRATQRAGDEMDRAKAQLADASRQVEANESERRQMLERSGRLAEDEMPSQLRTHLAGAGARRLSLLVNEKARLTAEEADSRAEVEAAHVRLRALERLVARVDEADAKDRRRAAANELQDLVVTRAVQEDGR